MPRFAEETYTLFAKQGFPKNLVDTFQMTADHMCCVVSTRTPGAAATGLIDERYDLKGFKIKAKSCDWGPMAGFVCQIPHFNKKGLVPDPNKKGLVPDPNKKGLVPDPKGKRADVSNREANLATLSTLIEGADSTLPAVFLPLMISDKRKHWFEEWHLGRHGSIAWANGDALDPTQACVGIAGDAGGTVMMEFWLRPSKQPALTWDILYGNIFARENANDAWQDASRVCEPSKLWPAVNEPGFELTPAGLSARLARMRGDARLPGLAANARFHPVCGVRNAYPPYAADGPSAYKNAVSGDFDLFAVWPLHAVHDTRRNSELSFLPKRPPSMFTAVPGKWLAVHPFACPEMTIEMVPEGEMFNAAEHAELGNVNSLVTLAAGTLNSIANDLYVESVAGTGTPRTVHVNQAFHSDEGGRPGIAAIEYPIAVFYPITMPRAVNAPQRLPAVITSIGEFARMVQDSLKYGDVALHHAWVADLLRTWVAADLLRTGLKGPQPPQPNNSVLSLLLNMFVVEGKWTNETAPMLHNLERLFTSFCQAPVPDMVEMMELVRQMTTSDYPAPPPPRPPARPQE